MNHAYYRLRQFAQFFIGKLLSFIVAFDVGLPLFVFNCLGGGIGDMFGIGRMYIMMCIICEMSKIFTNSRVETNQAREKRQERSLFFIQKC